MTQKEARVSPPFVVKKHDLFFVYRDIVVSDQRTTESSGDVVPKALSCEAIAEEVDGDEFEHISVIDPQTFGFTKKRVKFLYKSPGFDINGVQQ